QGDAIGNYILALARLLGELGAEVLLYSDQPNRNYPLRHRPSRHYRPTGHDILWLHYSIFSENIHWLSVSHDLKIFDFHGVCPPRLFAGYDPQMEQLCAQGEQALDGLADHADLAIAHTDYVRDELLRHGFRRIHKLPLIVDTARFDGAGDPAWEPLLSRLDYLLFVGRVVPQKGLLHSIDLFAELRRRRPGAKYFVVGPPLLAYAGELERRAKELGVWEDVVFTGPVVEARSLTSFYRHAKF